MFDEILTFFESKTKGERMARRSDFSPRDFVKYLPYIGLLEFKYNEEGEMIDAFCRLNGSQTIMIYGDLTGTWLSEMKSQEAFYRVKQRHKIMSAKRQGLAITSQILSKYKEHIVVKALYVPLSEDNELIDRLMLVVDYDTPNNAQDPDF